MGNPADLKPGSMISVQLMAGDLSRRRRRHRHPHRWQSHLRLRPPLPRYRLHRPALRARRSPHAARQHQHVLQNLHRQGMDGHHLPGPQHRRRRRTGQAARRWCRSRSPSRAPARRWRPTRCRWSTTRCFRRCCSRWPSSAPSTPPSAPSAPAASASPARSNFRTRPPRCASIICSPPITEAPCWPRSPPPSPSPSSCRAASSPSS